ncbi:MAG: hypothetical protein LBP95_02445 [Deltaproteobacteria bacterium]|jgi:hypothetical protein|nr:hypothetical protein [Deltaproteobacteria bacterium]
MRSFRTSPTETGRVLSAALAGLLACLVLAGCASGTGGAAGADPGRALSDALELGRAGRRVTTMAARGELNLRRDGSTHYFRFELTARKPGDFVFTVMDPLGRPAARVAVAGGDFLSLEYGPRLASAGEAVPETLGRFLPLGLRPEDFLAILSGVLVPEPAGATYASGKLRVAGAGFWSGSTWTVGTGSGPDGPRLERFAVLGSDGEAFSGSYSRFESVVSQDTGESVSFPRTVVVDWGAGRSLAVRYDEVALGFAPPAGAFSTAVPAGFRMVPL